MKIIFDSNVWQIIAIPDEFPNEICLVDFKKIRQAIIDKRIEAFLSETVFTIEAIRKVERQNFFSSNKAKLDFHETVTDDGVINLGISIGPVKGIDFNDRPILKKYFDEAIKLGFKIVRLPRITGMVNEEIEIVRYKQEGEELYNFHDKVFEVVQKIESRGAGMAQIQHIGKLYDTVNWIKGLKIAPETEVNKIAKAAAEWADGDSVSISIALGCNFFCTRDQAKGAGIKSIFSLNNLTWLKNDYGFETILPEDLAKLI